MPLGYWHVVGALLQEQFRFFDARAFVSMHSNAERLKKKL